MALDARPVQGSAALTIGSVDLVSGVKQPRDLFQVSVGSCYVQSSHAILISLLHLLGCGLKKAGWILSANLFIIHAILYSSCLCHLGTCFVVVCLGGV